MVYETNGQTVCVILVNERCSVLYLGVSGVATPAYVINCVCLCALRGLSLRGLLFQKLQTIGEDFCGLDVNTPLGGEQAISAMPVLLFSTRLTAVAATSTGDFTVVFVGTATGHLKKVSKPHSSNSSLHFVRSLSINLLEP